MSKWTRVLFLNRDVALDLDDSPVMGNGYYSFCKIRLRTTVYDIEKD